MNITDVRKEIDKIDQKILKDLNVRAKLAKKIGEIKSKSNNNIYDPARENQIIEALTKKNKGPLTDDFIKSIFKEIFSTCIAMQKKIKIAYLGPEATYTNIAAIQTFGKGFDYYPCQTIQDVFNEIDKNNAEFGVVPIENSTEGMVNYTLDVFMDSNAKIYSEMLMEIHHNLISKAYDISQIKKIYTHPQTHGQCRKWIESNLPKAKILEVDSNLHAVNEIEKDITTAAIASKEAAKLYGFNVLAQNIEDMQNNVTRFLIITNHALIKAKNCKTSILFSIKDKTGALYEMLSPFRKENINLTKIESRPTKKRAWEYVFFVDFLGSMDDPKIQKALKELEHKCLFLKILGSYPSAK
ncbi:prephenate dehydratase [bacterium]